MNSSTKRSAGIVIVRRIDGAWHYLILRSFRNWDFPKGLIEAGEEPLEAAKREANEETGLTEFVFSWGHDFRETARYAGGKIARYYVAQSPEGAVGLPVNPELGVAEHHEYRWVTYGAALKLIAPRLSAILDWAHSLVEHGNANP